jgi:ADP-ribose pyrophosphatase
MKKIRRQDLLAPWVVIDEHLVYAADPFLSLTRQHVVLPDGRHIQDYHQIVFPDYVTVVARTSKGAYILLRKYNHGYRRTCMLFPGGIRHPSETPRCAAARELLEETGYKARRWRCLGHFRPHSNYGCGQVHFYLGEDCHHVKKPDSGDLEAMEIKLLSHDALRRYLRGGRNPSLSCTAAFSLSCELLGLPGIMTSSAV